MILLVFLRCVGQGSTCTGFWLFSLTEKELIKGRFRGLGWIVWLATSLLEKHLT